ncbi:phage portal protein [Brucella intermedia]|uniref:phage portal protein n=1 Tax=Brucella intermedia TaxID=94625 RepID=UPI000E5C4B1C|nr:phage portal protein [Brucella intermedia]MCO7727355.1 phage portal protein [Brucella intermedia]QNQ40978.1 phage portal protein [Brucella intermedia]
MKLLDRIKGVGRALRSGTVLSGVSTRPTARMLRDSKSGVLAAQQVSIVDNREEIRRSWRRAAAYALDFIQNSGKLKGACDQVLVDTVGVELVLQPQPELAELGYSPDEVAALVAQIKREWKRYAWNPRECDMRGKFTLPQLVDIGLRWYMAYGEITGILDYMPRAKRRAKGIRTGLKVCMTPPSKLVQDTNEFENLFQGVYHDEDGSPIGYLFEEKVNGVTQKVRYPAFDAEGRPIVLHLFDPTDATDVRGISVLSSAIRKHAQKEVLDEATLQTAILQTIFAAVLTSENPSKDAFEALEALEDGELRDEFVGFLQAKMDKARESTIGINGTPTVAQLGPGEDLQFRTSATPGKEYLPFASSLDRETARAIGITYSSYAMDHSDATYSSVRMENATIWPIAVRRRERLAAPMLQAVYESWFDEMVGEGRIKLKVSYEVFAANREKFTWAQWQGPAAPTADDYKSERAVSERLANGTSSIAIEGGLKGIDTDELFNQQLREHQRYVAAGMRSPYERPNQPPLPVDEPPDETTKKKAAA